MTEQRSHNDIYHLVGKIEGKLDGIAVRLDAQAKRFDDVEAKLASTDDRVNNGELWQAEVRGMSRGVKYGLVLAAGVTGAAGAKGIEWVVGKLL